MRIHFRYKELDSQEQQVARLWERRSRPFTMAGLGGQPDLAPTICTYRAYFSRPETDPFSGNYEAIFGPISGGPDERCRCSFSRQHVPTDIRRKPARRPFRLHHVTRNTRACIGLGPRPRIPTSLRQLLRQSDGEATLPVGRRDFRKPRQHILRHCTLGHLGPNLPSPRPGCTRTKRRRH